MSSFGQTLRQAREAKGLSCSQVAAQTRILVQTIEEMENEDFRHIAAPIYGRGFVRLFAECVGLDPQPLVREFMDIYEGRRAPTVSVREVPLAPPPPSASAPAPEPQAAVAPEPAPIFPPPVSEPQSLWDPLPSPDTPPPPVSVPDQISAPVPEESPVEAPPDPISEPPPVIRGLDLFEQSAPTPQPPPPVTPAPEPKPNLYDDSAFLPTSYEESSGPSAAERFRTGLSSVSHGVVQSMRGIPRSTWRIAVLVIGALAVLGLAVFACMKLYQATCELPHPGATPAKPAKATKGGLEILPNHPPQNNRPATATPPKSVQKPAPAKAAPAAKGSGRLRSTGHKVPALYID